MTTFTEVLPERKASKRSAINWTPDAAALVVHTDRASVTYAVSEFCIDWPGRGFRLARLTTGTDPEGESYDVYCARSGPRADRCDCKGFTFKGTCKHADAVRALVANAWV